MKHTIKWWREGPKAVGIEYQSLFSSNDIEFAISEVVTTCRARLVKIYNEAGHLVAHYPNPTKHGPTAR